MTNSIHNAATSLQLPATLSPRDVVHSFAGRTQEEAPSAELRERFTQFVGEAFFGQMIKAMRATTGKPAYFHGGRAEEVFQGQLDQKLAEHLTEASAERFAEPMFERQFPNQAHKASPLALNQLTELQRR